MGNTIKGLLIKDWKLMNNQKQFWLLVVFFYLFFSLTQLPNFAVGYCTMMLSFCTLTTINLDDMENGAAYLFTLPFTRKDYVREKYLFSLTVTVIPWLGMNVLSYVISVFRAADISIQEYLIANIATLIAAYLLLAVEIPMQLKFGAEKSRIVLFVSIGFIFVAAYLLNAIEAGILTTFSDALERISNVGIGTVLAVAVVVITVLIGVSYRIAIHIVKNKEF